MQGEVLSAVALQARYGHLLRQAIPVDREGEVPRIAVRADLHTDAPGIILCSAVVQEGAELLIKSRAHVPVYVRRKENEWVDHGLFRALDLDRPASMLRHAET